MSPEDRDKAADLIFLAFVVWREARGESRECRLAVAYSVMNRVKKPGWWGKTVMDVLFKPWQYSSVTDPKDRQLTKWPFSVDPSWKSCVEVADSVLEEREVNPVKGADSYYDISLDKIGKAPKWASPDIFVKQIGRIRFYNVDKDPEV